MLELRRTFYFTVIVGLCAAGFVAIATMIARWDANKDKHSVTQQFLVNHYSARQIIHLPNGTFKMEGALLWQDQKWGEFAFAGLDDTVELPYDGQPMGARMGQIVLEVNSGSVRVREVK